MPTERIWYINILYKYTYYFYNIECNYYDECLSLNVHNTILLYTIHTCIGYLPIHYINCYL